MKHNIKYGVVAALTMAAFVAPSVSAVTIGSTSTSTTTAGVTTKSTELAITDTDTLEFTNRAYGSTWEDILYTAVIKDAEKSISLSNYASKYTNDVNTAHRLTWKYATSNSTVFADATDITGTDVPAAGTYYVFASSNGTTAAKGSITISPVKISTSPAFTVLNEDGKPFALGDDIANAKAYISAVDGTKVKVSASYFSDAAMTSALATPEYGKTYYVKATLDTLITNGDIIVSDNSAALTATGTFTLAKQDISNATVNITPAKTTYTGEEIKCTSITVNDTQIIDSGDADTDGDVYEVVNTQASNFSIAYSNNTAVGTATVTITGKGSYTGSISKTWVISAVNLSGHAAATATEVFTGSTITPKYITVGGTQYAASAFTITYKDGLDRVNSGTTSEAFTAVSTNGSNITTSATGLTGTLTISAYALSSATSAIRTSTVDLTGKGYEALISGVTYTGSAVKPTIKLYHNGNELSSNYYTTKLDTTNAVNVGDTVTIKVSAANGTSNVTGTDVSFSTTVKKAAPSVADATVSGIAKSYTYNGDTKEPTPTVTLDGTKLVEGTDYVVSYKSNVNVGTAKVVITGIGDYSGSITKTFYIDPAKSSIKKVAVGAKKMTVTVKKGTKATGVQIGYRVKGTSKWSYTKTTSTSKTIKSLKKGKKYQVVVRSYITNKSGKITNYSGWSATKTTAKIK